MAATLGEGGLHADAERSLHALVGGRAVEGHQRGHCNKQTHCQLLLWRLVRIEGVLLYGYINKFNHADRIFGV